MNNKINIIISAFLLSVMLLACYDDKGNYDYKELGQISVSGIEESYNCITFQDILHIAPVVSSDDPKDSFSYLWTINEVYNPDKPGTIKVDTIGEELVLDYPVNVLNGNYEVTFRVKNNQNGIETFHVRPLYVTTKFMDGFYVLKDMDGSAELDLHLPDKSMISNIVEKSVEGGIPGKPVSIGINPDYSYLDAGSGEFVATKTLNICTDEDAYIMNLVDMSPIYTHKTMFWGEEVPNEKPYYIWNNFFGMGYSSDQGIYYTYQAPSYGTMGAGKFNGALLLYGEERIIPSKYGLFSTTGESWAYIFFDELNGRFLLLYYDPGEVYDYPDGRQENKPNGITHKLIYMGRNCSTGPIGYALFEDADTPGKHYLYTMDIDPDCMSNPIKKVIEISPDSKLNKATLYATNELSTPVIYCVTDNQLYMYNAEQGTEELLSPEGFGSGEEITYLYNSYWTQENDLKNNFNYLAIGTYKAGKYKVYLYETSGGRPRGVPARVLEGDGRVVNMRFTSSMMNLESVDYYPGSF